jgi:hypothetical protein
VLFIKPKVVSSNSKCWAEFDAYHAGLMGASSGSTASSAQMEEEEDA